MTDFSNLPALNKIYYQDDACLNMLFRYTGLTEKGLQDKLEGNR